MIKQLSLILLLAFSLEHGFGQSPPSPLRVTNIFSINSSWGGECAAGVLDNRSTAYRINDYHSIYVTGTGSWTATLTHSTTCTGSFTSFGTGSAIDNTSSTPIAFGLGYFPFIKITITGSATAIYSGSRGYYTASAASAVSFPITVNEGGTNATTAAGARTSLGAAASGANSDITSLSGLTTPLTVPQGGTGSATLTGILQGNATSAFTTVTASAGSQYLRRNVSNTVYEFGSLPNAAFLVSTDYNYTSQSPGGTLTGGGGSQAVTLAPCPIGIKSASGAWSPIRFSAGSGGTAETLTPSGGTCTSGLSTGTVIVSPVSNHGSAYAVSSATAGIQEAVNAVDTARSSIYIPAGTHNTYATVTVAADQNIEIWGAGPGATDIEMMVNGDTIYYNGNTFGIVSVHDLLLRQQGKASGSELHVSGGGFFYLYNVHILAPYSGILIENVNTSNIRGVIINSAGTYGIRANAFSSGVVSGFMDDVAITMAGTTGTCLYLSSATGGLVTSWQVSNVTLQSGAVNLDMQQIGATGAFGESTFNNIIVDSASSRSIRMAAATPGQAFGITMNNIYGGTNLSNTEIMDIESFWGVRLNNMMLVNGPTENGIVLRGVKQASLTNSNIAATAANIFITSDGSGNPSSNITIANTSLGATIAGSHPSTYGAYVSAAAHSQIRIVDNLLIGSTSDLSWAGSGTFNYLGGNTYFNGTGKPDATTYGAALRGSEWYTPSASGSVDLLQVLRKSAADTYGWVRLCNESDPTCGATVQVSNYIATETGTNNAIAGALAGVALSPGLEVKILLAHTLQAGANAFTLNGGSAVPIKSHKNIANNIAATYSVGSVVSLMYDGSLWQDMAQ